MTDEYNSAAGPVRHATQPFEYGTHFIGPVHIHVITKIRLQRIKHDQLCTCFLYSLLQTLIAQSQLFIGLIYNQYTGNNQRRTSPAGV